MPTASASGTQRNPSNSGWWVGEVDVVVRAAEAQRVPVLALAAVAPGPLGRLLEVRGQLVLDGLGQLTDQLDLGGLDAGLLVQLTERRSERLLALVDAALRELPDLGRHAADPAAHEDQAIVTHDDDAHAGTHRELPRAHAGSLESAPWPAPTARSCCVTRA